MALALERKMRQDAKKNREKTQERLNTVRQDASYMTRLRSSDVVGKNARTFKYSTSRCKLYDTFAVFGCSCPDSECSKGR